MTQTIQLYFPSAYAEYFDDLLMQANKDRAEKEKHKTIGSLIYSKICEYITNLYPQYISWLPTKNFNNRRIDAKFTSFTLADLQDTETDDSAQITLVLTDKTLEKLCTLLAWIEALDTELQKQTGARKNVDVLFRGKNELFKNTIIEALKPLLVKVEEQERAVEEAEEKAASEATATKPVEKPSTQ